MDTERARVAIEVVAGIIPGTPIAEYSKRWVITSSQWYSDEPDDKDKIQAIYKEMHEYQASMMNPGYVNWVKTEWIYF